MNIRLHRLKCPLCNARFLSGYTLSECDDGLHERVEATCRQKHTVRLTVRKAHGEDGPSPKKPKKPR